MGDRKKTDIGDPPALDETFGKIEYLKTEPPPPKRNAVYDEGFFPKQSTIFARADTHTGGDYGDSVDDASGWDFGGGQGDDRLRVSYALCYALSLTVIDPAKDFS